MHNLHLVTVTAESGQEACQIAEEYLSDFGNENNWRTACGAVSEDNEVFSSEDGRYCPEPSLTIKDLNKKVMQWLKNDFYSELALKALTKGKKITAFTTSELWSLERYAKFLYRLKTYKQIKKERIKVDKNTTRTFDVLTDNFFHGEYNECGVTQSELDGDGKKWVVLIDMHS